MNEINITEQQFKDNWELIKSDMMDKQDLVTNKLSDISMLKKDRRGKLKLKKKPPDRILIGDKVRTSHGLTGEVVDVTDELVCVKLFNNVIEIWKIADVKKVE